MRLCYLDCFSGVSGNMLLAAVIDAGAGQAKIRQALQKLLPGQFKLSVSKKERAGLGGTHVQVMPVHRDHHEHRGLSRITGIIEQSDLPEAVKRKSKEVFGSLARAEARVHRIKIEDVHFHEVGAVDAIVDVVGSVLGLHLLGVEQIICSPLPLGAGEVKCAHGILPVPAPATLELLKGVPVAGGGVCAEMVTPTGAALVMGLHSRFGTMPAMIVEKTGYGLGDREIPGRPNLMRLIIGESIAAADDVMQIEATIDDMNPEYFDYLMDKAAGAGALEGMVVPVLLKKNRPGHLLRFLARPADEKRVIEAVLNHSTTLGVRSYPAARTVSERETISVKTKYGSVRVKKSGRPDRSERLHPEYEDLKALAKKHDIPLLVLERTVMNEIFQTRLKRKPQ